MSSEFANKSRNKIGSKPFLFNGVNISTNVASIIILQDDFIKYFEMLSYSVFRSLLKKLHM